MNYFPARPAEKKKKRLKGNQGWKVGLPPLVVFENGFILGLYCCITSAEFVLCDDDLLVDFLFQFSHMGDDTY